MISHAQKADRIEGKNTAAFCSNNNEAVASIAMIGIL
jgi:hypothetical protein